jgi:hypothetical protein
MVSLNKINYNIKNGAGKFLSEMGKGGYAPIILLEATVVAGRTYQAHKRGGNTEARERFTEETLGSVFWIGGVAGFNKLGDFVGKKILKLKDVNFEVGKDNVRNPFQNYIAKLKADKAKFVDYKKLGENLDELKDVVGNSTNFKKLEQKLARCKANKAKFVNFEKLEKNLATFKFVKIISSVLLANAFMGVIIPKVNQAITKKQLKAKNEKAAANAPAQHQMAKASFEEFINRTKKNNKDVSFNGISVQGLLNATNYIEKDATMKLLLTDVGTTTGRATNARNKNERLEILVRDVGSVYFYLYASEHLNSGLNYLQDGRATRLDPTTVKQLNSRIKTAFKNENYSAEEFEKLVFGDKNAEIPKEIQAKFQGGKEIITLEEFEKLAGKDSAETKIARKMSRLQPKLADTAIMTEAQVKAVYTQGLINDPRFLNKVFRQSTGKASTDPTKFVAEAKLTKIKDQMADYVKDIIKTAKKASENITLKSIDKAKSQNFRKNALNRGVGFAVSALFLSTLIPKAQYWITKKQTGQDKFPGVQ